jgi:hypothetical protein
MIWRQAVLGAWLGFLVLGLGGRLVMRGIAMATGDFSAFTLGGTLTVVASGTAAGVAGALFHVLAATVGKRFPGRERVIRLSLFALLLALVTARGLRGNPLIPGLPFWPLVALYGAAFVALEARQRPTDRVAGTGAGGRGRRWPLRFNRAPRNLR